MRTKETERVGKSEREGNKNEIYKFSVVRPYD